MMEALVDQTSSHDFACFFKGIFTVLTDICAGRRAVKSVSQDTPAKDRYVVVTPKCGQSSGTTSYASSEAASPRYPSPTSNAQRSQATEEGYSTPGSPPRGSGIRRKGSLK